MVILKGKRPSSVLHAILEALLFTSKYRRVFFQFVYRPKP